MLQNIRHIIFDLGGVLLNIDYHRTTQAFVQLGFTNFEALYTQLNQVHFFDDFETGKISKEQFIDIIKSNSPKSLTDEEIINAWNEMLLDFPLRRLQILQQLQLHFDTFLLSNTNIIHEEKFNQILKKQTGFPNLGVLFDKVYLSHRIGMRKPNKEAFELILHQNNLNPEKTLFIDDSPQHIEGAKALSIQTIWLQEGMTIEKDIFRNKNA